MSNLEQIQECIFAGVVSSCADQENSPPFFVMSTQRKYSPETKCKLKINAVIHLHGMSKGSDRFTNPVSSSSKCDGSLGSLLVNQLSSFFLTSRQFFILICTLSGLYLQFLRNRTMILSSEIEFHGKFYSDWFQKQGNPLVLTKFSLVFQVAINPFSDFF